MRYLSLHEYDDLLLASLRNLGILDQDAKRVINSRWPLLGPAGVLGECLGRGLCVGVDTVRDYVRECAQQIGMPDVDTDMAAFDPEGIHLFIEWCIERDRIHPTPTGEFLQCDDIDRVLKNISRKAAANLN